MTTYLQVRTLQRGVINPPEKLSDADQYLAERAAVQAGLERDPVLTQRQRWQEEIARRTPRKRVA